MTSVLIAGDFVPREGVASKFDKGQYEDVLGEVKPFVEQSDFSLVNLEAPIVEGKGSPIRKAGPNLRCNKAVIDALQYAGFKGVTLANNHFYDYGEEGALNTLSLLSLSNIDYVGAGKNLSEASSILYKTIVDRTFAFINCCEHEYSIAEENHPGSNPLDTVKQFYSIQEARSKADYVIVIVHGGIEGYQLPTLRMQEWYRFFIDCGADVVVNHHQHCYSGFEIYHSKPIFYGLGNFCFHGNLSHLTSWHEGYLLKLLFDQDTIDYELIPYIQCRESANVKITYDKKGFYKCIEKLNSIIRDPLALEANHNEHMDKTIKSQQYVLCPYKNKYLAALYVRGYLPGFLPLQRWRDLQNKIMCESHRERFLYFLNNKLK